jgi:hypothetical protein
MLYSEECVTVMNVEHLSDVRTRFARILLLGFLIHIGPPVPLVFGESSPAQISATGTIASHSTLKNELLPFTVTLRNDSASSLTSVRLVQTPQDYELQKVCMLGSDEKAGCLASQQLAATGYLLTDTILPGQSFTMWGELRPAAAHKTETLALIVGWKIARADAPPYLSSLVVPLGENQVLGCLEGFWTAVSEAAKLLLIPIALAVIGFLLNLSMKQREERIEKREKLRDEARQEAERDRTVRAETLKLMLQISHGYASQYYLPFSIALAGMAKFLRESITLEGEDDGLRDSKRKVAFYYHLLAWRRMSKITKAIGGFYLKDLRGEALVAECWRRHKLAVAGGVEDPRYIATRAAIKRFTDDTDSYQAFEEQFENSAGKGYWDEDIQLAWTLFQEWLDDKNTVKQQWMDEKSTVQEQVAVNLEAFSAILDWEANRPYQYWYDHAAKLTLTDETKKILEEMLESEVQFLKGERTEYFADVQKLQDTK